MGIMETLVLLVHVLAALAIIGLVLLQQGKGADMGSGFGAGASATVFGSAGSGSFLTRTTTIAALIFFATSFGLAYIARENAGAAVSVDVPALEVQESGFAGEGGEVPDLPAVPE